MSTPITNFQADRTFSNSILLTWEEVTLGTIICIVKNIRDYAYNKNDGTIIYQGPASWGVFEDTNVADSTWYYYQIYWYTPSEGIWNTDVALRVISLAIIHQNFSEILKLNSPNIYNAFELENSPDDSTKWQTLRDEIICLMMEDVTGLVRAFPVVYDVDNCPGTVLDGLSKLVGITPNYELSYSWQRSEIKAAVDIWKRKGTPESIKRAISAVTGLETLIDEWVDNILVTNRLDRTVFDFSNTDEVENYRAIGHTTSHRLDFNSVDFTHWYNTFSFGIYIFFTESTRELSETAVKKVRRILKDYIPVFTKPHIYFIANIEDSESYPYSQLDSNEDNIDTLNSEASQYGNILHYSLLGSIRGKQSRIKATKSGAHVSESWYDEIK